MIQSLEDYKFYLEADRIALKIDIKHPRMFQDEIWKFQRSLRKVEFLQNSKKGYFNKVAQAKARFDLQNLCVKLGYTISPNTFGPGLSIAHRGSIVVHPDAKVGKNCRIHQCVTIGDSSTPTRDVYAPRLGDNIFIGPGAVVVGNIEIADGIAIGANSFVNRSFTEPNITIAGCPARKISGSGSEKLWLRSTEILRSEIMSNNQLCYCKSS